LLDIASQEWSRPMSEIFALCLFLAALPFEQFSALGVTILKLAGGLALVVWLFSRLRSLNPIHWDLGLTLMVLFVGWGTASGLWSMSPAATMAQLPTYALLLVSYFLIVNVVRNEKQLSAAMIALWLGVLALLTSGAVDLAAMGFHARSRVSGIFGNPNGYVAMLVACIPSGHWVFTRTRVPFRRLVTAAALVVAVLTSLYSQSRGGILAIIVFLLSLLAFRQTRRRGAVFAVLVIALASRLAPLALWERWDEIKMRGGDVRTLELWPAGLRAFAQNPWLGSGLGTNAGAMYQVRGTRAGGGVVHNGPLAVAIELGLPGLALYLGFIAYALVRLLRALAQSRKQGREKETVFAVVLVASFVGYMTTWFKGGGAEYQKMLWVLLGLMSAYARILEQPPGPQGTRTRIPVERGRG
jgi:putative inorganic carbon (HCO3(-)) transporter